MMMMMMTINTIFDLIRNLITRTINLDIQKIEIMIFVIANREKKGEEVLG